MNKGLIRLGSNYRLVAIVLDTGGASFQRLFLEIGNGGKG